VARLFEAGLALDAVQHAAATEYCRSRAAAAGAALDDAVRELRTLAVELSDAAG
jgi:hypothetical protein